MIERLISSAKGAIALSSVMHQPAAIKPSSSRSVKREWGWVLMFFLLGLGLRVMNLDLKTAWMDEVSTVIFSLGNSSFRLPTEQIIDLEAMLRPITIDAAATPMDSARYLLQENNHPPLYFMLAHVWMDAFSTAGTVASLPISRLFSAIWGAIAIPAIFWASKQTFQSSLAGILSAAFMAVSPFSLFLSQEARHYGLAIVLVTLSIGCFTIAARSVLTTEPLSWLLCLGWITVNALAFANHYFSVLTFAGEAMVLGAIAGQQIRQQGISILRRSYWWPVYGVASVTALSVLAWLPILLNFHGSPQTTFLRESGLLMRWINPIAQTFAAVMTSFVTPANFFAQGPIAIGFIAVTILLTLAFIAKFLPTMMSGGKYLNRSTEGHIGFRIMGGFWLAMLGLFAFVCYVYGSDITRGLRYMFTYYPAVMILAGGVFSQFWQARSPQGPLSVAIPLRRDRVSGQRFVQITWAVGLLSTLMIVNNLAFPKYYAPDRFIPFMQAHSAHPIVVGSTEKIFEEPTVIGAKFLSIGWEIERHFPPNDTQSGWDAPPRFFALKQGYGVEQPLTQRFRAIVSQLSDPVDLWVIRSKIDAQDPLIVAKPASCELAPEQPQGNKGGYLYIHFRCNEP